MPDPDTSSSGSELLRLRRNLDDELRLEPPKFERLTAAQEAEAVELLAALFAAAASGRPERGPRREAA